MKKPYFRVILIVAVLVGFSVYFIFHKIHQGRESRWTKNYVLRLKNDNIEDAIRLIKEAVLTKLSQSVNLPEGYPKVENFNRDLWPIYADRVEESRISYRFLLNKGGDKIEIFYRKENEAEARGWSYTIYVLPIWPRKKLDPTYTQRIEIFIVTYAKKQLSEPIHNATINALKDIKAKEYHFQP